MDKSNLKQKNSLVSYIYAAIVALLVVACAVTIAVVSSSSLKQTANIGNNESLQVSANTFVLPMKNASVAKDYSASELQYNNTLKQWEIHKAIDFVATDDLNVYAVGNGTVSNVYTNYLEGTVVEITHNDGLVSVYKSLSKDVTVKVGDKVMAGDKIGSVAETMAAEMKNGAHLHFEMLKNGKKVNPNDYLNLGDK